MLSVCGWKDGYVCLRFIVDVLWKKNGEAGYVHCMGMELFGWSSM